MHIDRRPSGKGILHVVHDIVGLVHVILYIFQLIIQRWRPAMRTLIPAVSKTLSFEVIRNAET